MGLLPSLQHSFEPDGSGRLPNRLLKEASVVRHVEVVQPL